VNGKPFTEFEDNQLRTLHEGGATVRHMAMTLGRPYGSICTRRQHLGLSYRDGAGRGPAKQLDETYVIQTPEVDKVDDFDANGIIVLGLCILGALAYGAWVTAGTGL
jgi:hypothetical protein